MYFKHFEARGINDRDIFLDAIDIEDTTARNVYVRAQCGDNVELLGRVRELLESHEEASRFLNTPAAEQIAAEQIAETPPGNDNPTIASNPDSTRNEPQFADTMQLDNANTASGRLEDMDDEIPLGYLKPSTRPDSLGRLGHYEVLEVIGRGAFGTVLKAFDEKLHRIVAIKVLATEMAATSPARKRFLREARSSAAVRHENVVAIYAVEDKPTPYLVMEYVPGITLQQRLDEHGPLDLPDVLRLGKQIADGLAAAHAEDLIHRDVKPANILLESSIDDHVKITDFGLARTADDAGMTQSGMIAGTPMYMAPEQALGQKLDQRADLFSLGSVLYQMVSGRPPFRASSTVAVLKRVADDTPRPISEIIPETPEWMCRLIGHLHAKNPDDRYATAKEVSKLLAQCLEDLKAGRKPKITAPKSITDDSATDDSAKTEPSRVGSGHNHTRPLAQRPWVKAAAVVMLLCVGLGLTEGTGVTNFSSTFIRLATGSGTLVIESNDPGVKITIDGEEITIRGGGVEQLTLRPGDYEITATKDGKPVKRELVTITRNGRSVVTISLETSGGGNSVVSPKPPTYLKDGNYALSFDGKDDYVEIPSLKHDVKSPMTVEVICRIIDLNRSTLVDLGSPETSEFVVGTDD